MRQLDACDFCGDAADGVYEVVPAAVAGESRRLALCTDCRTTLQSVVDPLLDAAAGEPTGSAPDTDPEPPEPTTSTPEPTPAADTTGDADALDVDDSPATGTGDPTPTVTDDADGVVIDSGGTAESPDEESASDGTAEPERRPDGYAQVIRLLQNRDGAMPREDLRTLATNAYDLGGREFEDAVDAAVENGDVEETADGLRTA